MDGERRINVPSPETGVPDALGGFVQCRRARILRRHGVNLVTRRCAHHRVRSFPPGETDCGSGDVPRCGSASGIAVFTSDMAIIGRNRMNSRKSEVKIPIVPMYVQMSTHVG